MNDFSVVGAFLVGLMGAGHCLGMCGGIIGALALAVPAESHLPYLQQTRWRLLLFYHLGRIGSYTFAGITVASLSYFYG